MSPTFRAFYGALIGALTVLLAHPYSRPYVMQGVWFLDDSAFLRRTSMLPENLESLPEPRSFEDAGLWVVTACEQDLSGRKLTKNQTLLLLEVVQAAAAEDPDNAFWRQIEAVFLQRLGEEEKAIEAWTTSSLASRWNDYQNLRLTGVLEGLSEESGRNLAWHYAIVDSRKSSAAPRAIFFFARQLLREENVEDFELRLATLRNGKLLRDGARSVESSTLGTETIELSAYCSVTDAWGLHGVGGPITPRTLILAREDLLRKAVYFGPSIEEEIRSAFQEDDAREAFIDPRVVNDNRHDMMLASILTSALPGALITIGVIGGVVFLFGWIVSLWRPVQNAFEPPLVFVVGAVAAATVFLISGLFFPSLWAAVLLWSFAIRHDKERQAVPRGLGVGFATTIGALAVGFVAVLSYYFVARSLPGEYLLGFEGGSPAIAIEDSSLLALAGFIGSLAFVTAPVWAFIARVPSQRLVGNSVMKFGAAVCLGSFAFGVILVPAAIGVDRSVGQSLEKTFQNEPSYYLTQ